MQTKVILLTATALTLFGAGAPAAAQNTKTVPDQPAIPDKVANPQAGEQAVADASDDREIIVTARKRQESILQVPVVETVITQEQIERVQIQDIFDIATRTPGVVIGTAALEIGSQISIRGVGTTSLDPGIDSSTSLNLDGLQVSQAMAYSVGTFDMAQVEILKGPQALFYGKNSPAGVVSIRTADPGSEFEVIGRAGYEFEANTWRTEGIVSGPLTESLGARLAVMYQDYGGYLKNDAVAIPSTGAVQPGRRFSPSTSLFMRGTLVFSPSSTFNARLKVNYTKDDVKDGTRQQLVSCPDGLVNYTGIQFYSPREDCDSDRFLSIVDLNPDAFGGLRNNGRAFTDIRQYFGTLELNYDIIPNVTLTSVTGYYKLKTDALINGTNTGAAATPLSADKSFRRKEFTQEFRLNSDFSGPLNFSAGAFYQDANITNDIVLGGNTWLIVPVQFNPFAGFMLRGGQPDALGNRPGAPGTGIPARLQVGSHDVDIKSISFFGQLRYKIVPELEIAGGVRWTHEKREDNPQTVDLFGLVTGTPGATYFPIPPKLDSKNWSPELTITYTPTDDLTVFGSLKQGYKSGSFNLIVPATLPILQRLTTGPATPPIDFDDEKVQGGEIGVKARLADRQVFTNLAFYYYKYKGLQVGANEAATGGAPVIRTVNAGSAKVYGVDFDFSYRPNSLPELNVFGGVNWNIAKFIRFDNATCWGGQTQQEGCNLLPHPVTGLGTAQDLSGDTLPRAPKWQATLGADYEMPIGGDMTLAFGVDGQFSSKYKGTLGRRPDFFQPKYAKLNANIALKGPNDGWEVALIGNNLTNVLRAGTCTNLNYAGGQILTGIITGGTVKGVAGSDELACTVDGGREVWVRLTLRPTGLFGGKR